MRCRACDEALTDLEAVRKLPYSGTFADLCEPCFNTVVGDLFDVEIAGLLEADVVVAELATDLASGNDPVIHSHALGMGEDSAEDGDSSGGC